MRETIQLTVSCMLILLLPRLVRITCPPTGRSKLRNNRLKICRRNNAYTYKHENKIKQYRKKMCEILISYQICMNSWYISEHITLL